jgi:hypothetical protein
MNSPNEISDELSRRLTQAEPLEIPQVPGAFWLKVKVDHTGVFRPHKPDYVYESVLRNLRSGDETYEALLRRLGPIWHGEKMREISDIKVDDVSPYLKNGMFEGNDARALYSMIALMNPRKVVEVGSGHSTKFMRRAVTDYALSTRITAIDPVPRDEISSVADEVIRESVEDVPLRVFEEISQGDFLFWDGSHIVFNGTDTTHLFLNILPALPKGVIVHIHDIQLPLEYDRGYSAHYYNEQYMLAVLLLNSRDWSPLLPLHYLGKFVSEDYLGRSFWMTKTA